VRGSDFAGLVEQPVQDGHVGADQIDVELGR